jgi:N-acetylmuramoyl-L-alanine amidase
MFLIFKRKSLMVFALVLTATLIFVIIFSVLSYSSKKPPSIGITVVIDAGHGGIDDGTVGLLTKVKESELNLKVAKELKSFFVAAGVNVVMTRENSEGLYGTKSPGFKRRDMNKRKEIIEKAKPDLVISIHMNKFPQSYVRGARVFFCKESEKSETAAIKVQNALNKNVNERTFTVLKGDYFILNCTEYTSILVECGFLSNVLDEQLLQTSEHRKKVAYQIFAGSMDYLTLSSVAYLKFM